MSVSSQEMRNMVLALVVVAIVATLALGLTEQLTRQPIEDARKATLHKMLKQVLPAHANDVIAESFEFVAEHKEYRFYPAFDLEGHVLALAWNIIAPDGYAGKIQMVVGVEPNGHLFAMRVIQHRETPGLGDGIVDNQSWLDAFSQRNLSNVRWAVKKDGGDFDQFTGATITPRAVVNAVHHALSFFDEHQVELMKQAIQNQAEVQVSRP